MVRASHQMEELGVGACDYFVNYNVIFFTFCIRSFREF